MENNGRLVLSIKSKYHVEQTVWYIQHNRICSGKVGVITLSQIVMNETSCDPVRFHYWLPNHGTFREDQVFGSKKKLIESL